MLLAAILMAAASCARHSGEWQRLAQADALMEERPDSALEILSGIDHGNLAGDEERARHALLMSMALDKNWVDTADFAVLQPAIDYYLDRGTPDEKLRTLYYQGKVFRNKGDNGEALLCFLRGESLQNEISDTLTLANLLYYKGIIQKDLYEHKSSTASLLHSAKLYDKVGKADYSLDCLWESFKVSLVTGNSALCDSLVAEIKARRNLSPLGEEYLRRSRLKLCVDAGNAEEARQLADSYPLESVSTISELHDLAHAYVLAGEAGKAWELLSMLKGAEMGFQEELRQKALCVVTLEAMEQYDRALAAYKNFTAEMDSLHFAEYEQKARFMEEKHAMETMAADTRRTMDFLICGIAILCLAIALASLFAWHRFKARKAESRLMELQLVAAEKEADDLKALLGSENRLPEEVREIIETRFRLLNSLCAQEIASMDPNEEKKKGGALMELIEDRENFLKSNRLAIQGARPRFVDHLCQRGLTTKEIEYACLYAIGLSGKQIAAYLKRPGHFNASSEMRRNLGLSPRSTNLGIHIRRLFDGSQDEG